ncbi:hypothetical protein GDO78_018498 [Eleutherodactylus coqui]|uniref:Uncharacterized protein n=1 Tax=Eleutherodactylus coqui TaxID=57060 RepID=A0A8J6BQ74_ELECQ|nr:hypothetical protein GDO78_018498 [Eleutherodactylus coqui]KAG9465329.1 hypothetical protein GDO78_018498 [Eleutherodactylus coqui]KAG9465330.1 hypothetical protein GDO78_018498 [Eleutherodactylus coqui]
MTESILTPTSRSPIFFQGFQKRDSFSSPSASSPQTCSPAFIFSKSSLPITSPKVDSLPSFIPPPITAIRVTPTQVKGTPPLHTPPRTGREDLPFRAEYVTVSPAEQNAAALNSKPQARPQHQDLHSEDTSGRSACLYKAELVAVNAPSTSPEVQELPNKIAKLPTNFTAIKSVISFPPPVTEVAFTSPAPITEPKIPAAPQSTEKVLPTPPSALGGIEPTTSAADITPPAPASQVLLASALIAQEGINKTSNINFCSDETVMSTDLALSHEPKRSSGSTSLVSLLAPIPYTPYRTQRPEGSSLRSSSSAVPLRQHALLSSMETSPLVTFSIPSPEASPSSAVESSKISLESKDPALGKVTQNSSPTTSPVTVAVWSTGGSAESQVNIIHTNILIPESSSLTVPIEISAELQSYAIQADDLLPEPSPISFPTKSSAGPQLRNIHADIPLVESSHEPPSITTESTSSQLNVQADIPLLEPTYEPPSITTRTLSGQLNVQADTLGIELSHEPPSKTTEGSSGQLNDQAAIPLMESSSGPSCITTEDSSGQLNVQANILLRELTHELPSKTTQGSSCQLNAQADSLLLESSSGSSCIITEGSSIQINVQSDIPLLQLACEPPSITTEGSSAPLNVQANIQLMQSSSKPSLISSKGYSGPQLTNIQTDIPLLESSSESLCITTEGSFDQLYVQDDSPLVEPTYKSQSITTEGSSSQLNFQADIRLMKSSSESSWITTEGFSGPQLNNIQADIPLLELSYEPSSITTEGSSGQLNAQVDIPSMGSLSEPSQITSDGSSGPHLDNIYADIPLIEHSHGPPSIITKSSLGQLNIQADIQIMESSSESSWTTTEGSSGPPFNNIQADMPFVELSYEPLSKTNDGPTDQLNVQADMPVIDCPSEPAWITSDGSSGPQANNIHASVPFIETSHEPSSIIPEGYSGQLNIKADIQIMESSSESSWITTEGSSGPPNKNNIQADIPFVELSYEPLSKTTDGPTDQLNVQAYMPVMDCPSEPSWITSEGSSGPQVDNIHANILLIETSHEPSSIITEGSSGQLNIQADIQIMESSSESSWITTEGSSGPPNKNNIQAYIPFLSDAQTNTSLESSVVGTSLSTVSSAEPQININQESVLLLEFFSICPPCQSSGEPQGSNIQANIQSSPVSLFRSEISTKPQPENIQPIALPPASSVSPSVQTTISSEFHPNYTLTDIPLMRSLPASSSSPTEGFSESQPKNIQDDIQLAELLPISSSIPTKSPVERHPNDFQPKIVLETSSPPPTDSSIESQLVETDLAEQESSSTSSIVTTLCSPESQPNNRSGAQSPESMEAFAVPFTENSPESQSNYVQPAYLVQESSIPTNVSPEFQPNYMEAEILPLEPPPALPTEAQLHYIQTNPLLTESSFIGEFSPIAIGSTAEPLPYNVHKHSSLTETTSGSSSPSTENIPESQPSNNNENSPWLFSIPICSAEESLLNTIQMEETLTESAPVSTCPAANISDHDEKPNCSKFEVPSEEISLPPILILEDVLPNQFLPPCLPSDCSPECPLRSSSPSCEMVYAEKVILFEDPHPGSPPVNGNLIIIESVTIDDPGELKEKLAGNVLENVPVHDVPSSSNIIVAEDPVSDPKLIPSCEQLLKQFRNSSEALL